MNNQTIGQKIKFYRERIKKSQMDLEVEIGASTGSISRMENGVVNPTKETLSRIAKALHLTSKEVADILNISILSPIQIIAGINKLSSSLDLDTTLQTAVDIMYELYPHHNGGGILLLDKNDSTKLRIQSMTRRPFYDEFMKLISVKLNQLLIPLGSKNYVTQSFEKSEILQTFDVTDFTRDVLPQVVSDFLVNIFNFRSGITIPLLLNGVKLGMVLYTKNEKEIFTQEEIEVLKLYTEQIAIAINNSKAFEEMKNQLNTLKDQIK